MIEIIIKFLAKFGISNTIGGYIKGILYASILAGAGYLVIDYTNTKTNLSELKIKHEQLEADYKNINKRFDEIVVKYKSLSDTNAVIEDDYRDALDALDELSKLSTEQIDEVVTVVGNEPPQEPRNIIPKIEPQKEVQEKLNLILIKYNNDIRCYTGNKESCVIQF